MRSGKKRKKRKIFFIILSIIAFLILIAGGYSFYLWNKAASTVASIQQNINKSSKRDKQVDITRQDPISILIMGVDERKGDKGRSDSLIYLTVNPKTKTTEMVSIPRDTYTKIIGKGTMDKINHSYAFGGIQMTVNTVEHLLDVPVDYFVKVNMDSFKDIVGMLGGITVNSKFAFHYDGYSFGTGSINLNGVEALAYSRMRYEDPKGDFGRQERQRQVIEGIIDKGANISSITKFGDLFKVVENNVKTNLTFDDMWEIQSSYKGARTNVIQHELKGEGTKINGIYYYKLNEDSLTSIKNQLKESLDLRESASAK